ncbi:helix-turn-helix domain-containing protein [Streptomyces sp. NPDC099050]|uniref:helix-turn-helix domain-containing protein n=1 Tax=Streptomyces sp. NPDC099050 TaxID=3366100 RepID=UPI0038294E1D
MTSSHTLSPKSARATARPAALPAPGERRRLRELWGLTPAQVAVAFDVRVATVRSWESGRSTPTGKRREAYRRFLQGLAQRADLQPKAASLPASRRPQQVTAAPPAPGRDVTAPSTAPPEPVVGDRGEASAIGWLPHVAAVAVIFAAWALALVFLDVHLPGWAG